MAKPAPIPPGFHTLTPHLVQKDSTAAIDWYKKALGAEEVFRMAGPGGRGVGHAQMKVGSSTFMMADEFPGMNLKSPQSVGSSTVGLHLYVTDCDAAFKRAVDAGAKPTMPPVNMFWGDRYAKFTDPFGHEWSVATHVEDVPPQDMGKRAEAAYAQMGKGGKG